MKPTSPTGMSFANAHRWCPRFSHETIFETALGRHIPVELVETIRRGGKTCHLVAHLA
jgi:hypothetical protein